MRNTRLFLMIILLCGLIPVSAQKQLLEGNWQLLPEKSAQIDLFNTVKLNITYTDKQFMIERIWGAPSREFRDTFDLQVRSRKQTEIIQSRVFPTNVFMGMKVAEGQRRELTLDWKPGEIVAKIQEEYPGMVSQGDRVFQATHTFELEPVRNILTYTISRTGRENDPIVYVFKRKGAYDACSMSFDANWQVKSGLHEKAALLSLQGIVNQEYPQLYFEFPENWDFRFTPQVKDFLETYHYYTFKQLKNLEEAIKQFRDDIKGYIIWDDEVRTSLIVSFTLAGLTNSIVVDESLIDLMNQYEIPRTEDFRGMFSGWSDIQIYEWARNKYWDQCSRDYIVWMGGDAGAVMRPGVADWGIRNKAFFSDLSTKVTDSAEYALADTLLGEMNDMAMVFGWHSYAKDKERDHVTLTSSHGLRVEGLHTLPNMSFMSHIEVTPGFEFKNNHSVDPKGKYTPARKVYISCVQTDCLGLGAWTRPGRGDIPYAWEVTMNWVWLAPAMMEFFYSQATPNDYFIGSLSGPGYMYPKAMPKEQMPAILKEAERLMKILDLRIFEVMDYSEGATIEGNTEIPKDIVREYVRQMPDVIGFINGYAPSFTFGEERNKPFISYDYYLSPERPADQAAADLRELAAWNPERPYFLLMHVRQWSDISRVKGIIDQLGAGYELIPLDLFMMYVKAENTFTERYLEK